MARFTALFVSLFAFLFVCVGSVPAKADLGGLSLGDIINALKIGFVKDINAIITLESFETNLISVNFDAKNPVIVELTIDRVVSKAGLNGTVYATFDQKFTKPLVVSPLGTKNSGTFGNVLLTQGVAGSLDIIPFGVLDLLSTDVYARAGTIGGYLGIPLVLNGLKQSGIPTTYNLSLGFQ